MRTLFVLRHAKSSWADPRDRDFDRPLNERGRDSAAAVGRYLRDRDWSFDLVLASPAVRVRQTIDGIEETYGRPLDPDFREPLYNAPAAALAKQLRSIGDSVEKVLLVGHNPGLQQLVLLLADADSGDIGGVAAKFPTAALAELEVRGGWHDLRPGSCPLIAFVRPSDLAAG